jgi:hypothetical protein
MVYETALRALDELRFADFYQRFFGETIQLLKLNAFRLQTAPETARRIHPEYPRGSALPQRRARPRQVL